MTAISLPHAYGVTLDKPQAQALSDVRSTLEADGVGILYDIDLKETIRLKLGVDIPAQHVLGVCIAPLAYRALQVEPSAGALLPCSISVYERADGGSTVVLVDPAALLGLAANDGLSSIADEAADRLQHVMRHLDEHTAMPVAVAAEVAAVEEIC